MTRYLSISLGARDGRRRFPSAPALALALSFVLTACGSGAESGSNKSFVQTGELTVGSDLTYPPYAYLQKDKPSGFDAEIGNSLAESMNREADFKDTRFEQLIPGLKSKRFDVIISSLYITAERAKLIDYVPYFMTGTSIIVPSSGDFSPRTPADLCGKRVGSIKGSAILPSLLGKVSDACVANGDDKLIVREFPTDPEATQALLSGNVDVQMTEAAVAKVAVDKTGERLEISSTELLYPIAVGIGVNKGNDEVVQAVKQALAKMKKSGEYEKILAKYNVSAPDPELVKASLKGELK